MVGSTADEGQKRLATAIKDRDLTVNANAKTAATVGLICGFTDGGNVEAVNEGQPPDEDSAPQRLNVY